MKTIWTLLRSVSASTQAHVKPLAGYTRLAGTGDVEPVRAQKDAPPASSFTAQLPVYLLVVLLLIPQPSLVSVPLILHRHHLISTRLLFGRLFLSSSLYLTCMTFLWLSLFRDPGRVRPGPEDAKRSETEANPEENGEEDEFMNEEMSLEEFMKGPPPAAPVEVQPPSVPGKRWCKICEAPKPERAHHCSSCGRCVLKMDHHCIWLARCVGFRTLPSFFLFLVSTTFYAMNACGLGGYQVYHLVFVRGYEYQLEGQGLPVLIHSIVLTMLGFVFSGSLLGFSGYHAYLISTNQTTLEHLHPYILTPFLPPPAPFPFDIPYSQSPPQPARWDEYYMNHDQRRTLRAAGKKIRMWDLGLGRNWMEAFGGRGKGGRPLLSGKGDGHSFPHNPKAEEMLEKLVKKLETQGPVPDGTRQGQGVRPTEWESDDE